MKNKKAYLQISFSWMFAIVVGAFILFLAIFFLVKFMNTEQTTQDLKTAKEIGILLNPLEIGFEENRKVSLKTSVETRISSRCDTTGNFGAQKLLVNEKIYGKWSSTNLETRFENKYLFLKKNLEGKSFYLFSKPFEFPFKVASLIYLTSTDDSYCFIDAPSEIEEEIGNLNQENLKLEGEDYECSEEDIKICFGSSSNCDVLVDYNEGSLKKDSKTFFFEGDTLMYAAIFSEKEFYECQVERLMKRTQMLNKLYTDKLLLEPYSESYLGQDLFQFSNLLNNYRGTEDLSEINSFAKDLGIKNKYSSCRMW